MGEHAIALGAVSDRVTAMQHTLVRQFPDLADELKGQIAADQEQSRKSVYELQVSLAKVRELIARVPEPGREIFCATSQGDAGSVAEPAAKAGKKKRMSNAGGAVASRR